MSQTPPLKGKGKGKGPPPPPKSVGAGVQQKGPPPPGKGAGKAGKVAAPAYSGPKLRPLFWQALSQVPSDSVWTELRPPAHFDVSSLERQFALSQPRAPASGSDATARRPIVTEETRKRLRILDDKSSQLLAIAFNRLPPPEQLGKILRDLEDFPDCLHAEAVLALNAAATEQHEAVEQIRQLEVQVTELQQLGEAERYLWVLSVVPDSAAKLRCGALILGQARELTDLRLSSERVASCCQALRTSDLLHRTVSTSLAVGNFLNRSTARCIAQAVALPDALLKFEELRGVGEAEDGSVIPMVSSGSETPREGGRGPTLLDFVAQALVDEATASAASRATALGRTTKILREEAEALRAKALAAGKADLEDADATCKQVLVDSAKARQAVAHLAGTAAADRLAERVRGICREAEDVSQGVKNAKEVLKCTQQWSSTKSSTKGSDWFSAWASFLEQLAAALARTRPSRPPVALGALPQAPGVAAPRPVLGEMAAPPQQHAPLIRGAQRCDAAAAPNFALDVVKPPQPASQLVETPAPATMAAPKKRGVVLDDDARIGDMGALKDLLMKPTAGASATVMPTTAASQPVALQARRDGSGIVGGSGARHTLFAGWNGAGKENATGIR